MLVPWHFVFPNRFRLGQGRNRSIAVSYSIVTIVRSFFFEPASWALLGLKSKCNMLRSCVCSKIEMWRDHAPALRLHILASNGWPMLTMLQSQQTVEPQ
jgi:hypothetical protein